MAELEGERRGTWFPWTGVGEGLTTEGLHRDLGRGVGLHPDVVASVTRVCICQSTKNCTPKRCILLHVNFITNYRNWQDTHISQPSPHVYSHIGTL